MDITNTNLTALFQDYNTRYQSAYTRRRVYWTEIAELVPSMTETEVYHWLAELPGLREWIGPRLIRNLSTRAYTLTNKDFENTVAVPRRKIQDDQYGVYARQAELMGDAAARWPDDLVFAALVAGGTSTCFDGQYFFDTDHPVDLDDASLGTYANLLTTAALTHDTFAAAWVAMQKFKGESGKSLEIQPTHLVVPPTLRKKAKEILSGELTPETIKNVAGAENVGAASKSNVLMNDVQLIVAPRLEEDSSSTWYLLSCDRIRPFVFQQRQAPEFITRFDPASDNVFHLNQFEMGTEARGAAGYTLPFLAVKNTA